MTLHCNRDGKWRNMAAAALMLNLLAPAVCAEPLGFLNWTEYTAEEAISSFSEQSGTAVILDTYNEAADTEAKLHAGGTGYDVVVIPVEMVGRLRQSDVLAPFDKAQVPNADGVDGAFMEAFFEQDPSLREFVQPYLWGYTGLFIDRPKVAQRIPEARFDSWSLVFDPANAARLADCGLYIVNSPQEVLSAALAYLGRDPNSSDPRDLSAAFQAIEAIIPYVQDIRSDHYDVIMDKEACAAITWSTEGLAPIVEEGDEDRIFFAPKEGTNIWLDAFVLPSDAPNPGLAHSFVNHMLAPRVAAAAMGDMYAPSAIPAARSFLDPEMASNTTVFPPREARRNWYVIRSLPPVENTEMYRSWRRMFLGL